jgi:hypothetical protein
MKTKLNLIAVVILTSAFSSAAQTGSTFDLSHNVVAGGGGMQSAGGNFKVDGTVGQPLAGTVSTGTQFNLHGGFWFANPLAPTAASVSAGGRVSSLQGAVLRRVRVILTDTTSGVVKSAQVNPFGYYRFDDLETGRVYIVRAESRNFTFTPEMQVFTLLDGRDDIDFTAVRTEP